VVVRGAGTDALIGCAFGHDESVPRPDRRHGGGRLAVTWSGAGSVLAMSVKLGTLDERGNEKGL
jgi:hypothetical protein